MGKTICFKYNDRDKEGIRQQVNLPCMRNTIQIVFNRWISLSPAMIRYLYFPNYLKKNKEKSGNDPLLDSHVNESVSDKILPVVQINLIHFW